MGFHPARLADRAERLGGSPNSSERLRFRWGAKLGAPAPLTGAPSGRVLGAFSQRLRVSRLPNST
jgi:hypothetical protein